MATNNKPIERLTLSVEEAGKVLGISRATAYSLANQGLLPIIKLGKRILVSKAGLERMINDVKIKVQEDR